MNCSRCGARTSGICPRCDAQQSPDPVYRGLSFLFLPGWSTPQLRRRLKIFVNRRWGEHHRLLRGELWDDGEQELSRISLQAFSMYTVDRYAVVWTSPVAILTNQRLIVCDASGEPVQVGLRQVGAVHDYRDYDPRSGFSHWVAIDRSVSSLHDPKGDFCLRCRTQEESVHLAALIRDASRDARAATVYAALS